MNRMFIQTSKFSSVLDQLIKENKLFEDDFIEFEKLLLKNPEEGDLVAYSGGCRKSRLKSASKGKRGGFRLYYLDIAEKKKLFFLVLYGKNVKSDLSNEEKRALKAIVDRLREE